jgi:hypothetical protein
MFLVLGCDPAPTFDLVVGVDRTVSSTNDGSRYLKLKNALEQVHASTSTTVYAFDSFVELIHEDSGPRDAKLKRLNTIIKKSASPEKGSRLNPLFEEIEKKLRETRLPARIFIFTDCGFDGMSEQDFVDFRSLKQKLIDSKRIESIRIYGLDDKFKARLELLLEGLTVKFEP